MKRHLLAGAPIFILNQGSAMAAPNCWGMIAAAPANKKVACITSSDDHAAGTAASYSCKLTWKARTVDQAVTILSGTFNLISKMKPRAYRFPVNRSEPVPHLRTRRSSNKPPF
jgi:hypothetical protein